MIWNNSGVVEWMWWRMERNTTLSGWMLSMTPLTCTVMKIYSAHQIRNLIIFHFFHIERTKPTIILLKHICVRRTYVQNLLKHPMCINVLLKIKLNKFTIHSRLCNVCKESPAVSGKTKAFLVTHFKALRLQHKWRGLWEGGAATEEE